jgi:SAM-dependent methyltransferase
MDADAHRSDSREAWSQAARGWRARREHIRRMSLPASRWMVEAIAPQPGHVVLELAAGVGDTGFMAAELVEPGGRLISSDFAEPMLDAARERGRELGIENVEFRVLDAESIDLPVAAVDGVLCRWGFMLMADPGAALREARRVLRPGGRLALAAWDEADRNPWVSTIGRELVRRGLAEPAGTDPGGEPEPGMFAFAPAGRIERLLDEAGFSGAVVEAVDLPARYASFEEWWETTLDLSAQRARAIAQLDAAGQADLRERMRAETIRYTAADGALEFPARTLVAAAEA